MLQLNKHSSLAFAGLLFFGISFKYHGEEMSLNFDGTEAHVSFALIWRVAASILVTLWVVYVFFHQRLHFEALKRLHIGGTLLLALCVIGIPFWGNYVTAGARAGLILLVFILTQFPLVLNFIKSKRDCGFSLTNTGRPL